MFCYKCGAENLDGASYCQRCGIPLSQTESQPAKTEQSVKPGEVTLATSDACLKGCGKGCGSSVVQLFGEIIIAVIIAYICDVVIFWLVLNGDMNSPWAAPLPVILFIFYFLVVHYGTEIRKKLKMR